jgi:biopolymer transport protein ExbD
MKLPTVSERRKLVNLTPLIDVVFMLLIFFMLASSFTDWQMLELAVGDIEELRLDLDEASTIQLRPSGESALDGKIMTHQEIVRIVRERVRRDARHAVIIETAAEVRLQILVTLLEELHQFAPNNVSLVRSGPE